MVKVKVHTRSKIVMMLSIKILSAVTLYGLALSVSTMTEMDSFHPQNMEISGLNATV